MAAKKELAVPEVGDFLVFGNHIDLETLVRQNLGGQLRPNDLERVKVPAAGGVAWQVPSLDGYETSGEIDGIVLYAHNSRAYWKTRTPTKGTPPDCTSENMTVGVGSPGGLCEKCSYNQWASDLRSDGKLGRGKACRERVTLYVLRRGALIPIIVTLPVTSIREWRNYAVRLTRAGLSSWSVVTRITLDQKSNRDGQEYSEARFQRVGELTLEQRDKVQVLSALSEAGHRAQPPEPVAEESVGAVE